MVIESVRITFWQHSRAQDRIHLPGQGSERSPGQGVSRVRCTLIQRRACWGGLTSESWGDDSDTGTTFWSIRERQIVTPQGLAATMVSERSV